MSAQNLLIQIGGSPVTGAATIPVFTPTTTFSPTGSDYTIVATVNADPSGASLAGVGMWITQATWAGEQDVRTGRAPETDLLDLIKLGDAAVAAGGPTQITHGDTLPVGYQPGGLWVRPSTGSVWYRVTSNKGTSKSKRFGNYTLAAMGTAAWLIFLEPPSSPTAIRYFFDIMVEDGS